MLNQLRSAVRSWVAGIFIALLAMSFAVWGVSDMFTGRGRGAVAVVGDTRITTQEFATVFRRRLQQAGEETGRALTAEEAVEMGLDTQLLALLIRDASVEEAANELGLWVSDDLVADEISRIDAFRNPITGDFDVRAYQRALRQIGETADRFEQSVRDNLLRAQLQTAIGAGVSSPAMLVDQRARYDAERRRVTLVRIPASATADPGAPSEEEIAAYYEENAERYAAPETRAITLFILELDQMTGAIEIDDAQVAELYEQRRAEFETPERRTVVEMTAPSEEIAADIAQRLEAGEEPDAIAAALILPEPIIHDAAERGDFVDRVAGEHAFTLEEGAVSAPFRGSLAWKIVRVDAVEEGAVTPLEEAAPLLRNEAARAEATTLWIDSITNFNRLRDRTGATLEEAANEIGAAAISIAPFDEQGRDLTGYAFQTLIERPEIIELAFDRAVGAATELTPIGDSGYFALRVDRVVASAPRPLDDVRDEVADHWTRERRAQELGEMADRVRDALDAGQPSDVVASTASPEATTSEAVIARNLGLVSGVDPRLETLIFGSNVGDVVIGGGPGVGAVIARLDEVIIADELSEAARERARTALDEQLAVDIAELYRRGLQRRYDARVNAAELRRATGLGDGT